MKSSSNKKRLKFALTPKKSNTFNQINDEPKGNVNEGNKNVTEEDSSKKVLNADNLTSEPYMFGQTGSVSYEQQPRSADINIINTNINKKTTTKTTSELTSNYSSSCSSGHAERVSKAKNEKHR